MKHRLYKTAEWKGELSPVEVVLDIQRTKDLYVAVCQTLEELKQAKEFAKEFDRSLIFAPASICPEGILCPWIAGAYGYSFSSRCYTDSAIRYIQ